MSKINKKFFFDTVRQRLFGKLSVSQVGGLTAILNYWEEHWKNQDDRWLAYALGTTFHETDQKMQPIIEYGKNSYFNKYEGRKDLGNTEKEVNKIDDSYTAGVVALAWDAAKRFYGEEIENSKTFAARRGKHTIYEHSERKI